MTGVELTYFEAADQHVNHYIIEIPLPYIINRAQYQW